MGLRAAVGSAKGWLREGIALVPHLLGRIWTQMDDFSLFLEPRGMGILCFTDVKFFTSGSKESAAHSPRYQKRNVLHFCVLLIFYQKNFFGHAVWYMGS